MPVMVKSFRLSVDDSPNKVEGDSIVSSSPSNLLPRLIGRGIMASVGGCSVETG